ncbi:MAG TPA: AMP-binding protein, partial [Acidimicrobiales bacterium]|nr:AMP-binding protein [Acidimicrobiales bacterium]
MTEPLFPSIADPDGREAVRIGNAALSYGQLAGAATATADQLHGAGRVVVWAEPTLELVIAVVGALAAGVAVVPINPGLGP